MIFYLCQTPAGPQLAGTQADAKALDRNFKQVEEPTDKAGLMKRLNELLAKAHRPAVMVEPTLSVEALADAMRHTEASPGTVLSVQPVAPKDNRYAADTCPSCHRNPRAAALLAAGEDVTEITDAILATEHTFVLDRVADAIAERRAELATPAPAAPARRIRRPVNG